MSGNYVIFTLNDEIYGIDILNAQEIIRVKGIIISQVPKVPKFISGIINLRGDVVPIIRLKLRFDLIVDGMSEERIIIVEHKKLIVGFLVDSIVEVLYIAQEELSPPPEDVKLKCEYVDSIVCKENRMIFILSTNKIIEVEKEGEDC